MARSKSTQSGGPDQGSERSLTVELVNHATTISAKVEDFNFDSIIACFTKALEYSGGIKLQDFAEGGPRQLVIELHITETLCDSEDLPWNEINRWQRWLSNEGAAVQLSYRFHDCDLRKASALMEDLNPGRTGVETPWTRIIKLYWECKQRQPRLPKNLIQRGQDQMLKKLRAREMEGLRKVYAEMDATDAAWRAERGQYAELQVPGQRLRWIQSREPRWGVGPVAAESAELGETTRAVEEMKIEDDLEMVDGGDVEQA